MYNIYLASNVFYITHQVMFSIIKFFFTLRFYACSFAFCIFTADSKLPSLRTEHSYKKSPKMLNQLQFCEDNGIPLVSGFHLHMPIERQSLKQRTFVFRASKINFLKYSHLAPVVRLASPCFIGFRTLK